MVSRRPRLRRGNPIAMVRPPRRRFSRPSRSLAQHPARRSSADPSSRSVFPKHVSPRRARLCMRSLRPDVGGVRDRAPLRQDRPARSARIFLLAVHAFRAPCGSGALACFIRGDDARIGEHALCDPSRENHPAFRKVPAPEQGSGPRVDA